MTEPNRLADQSCLDEFVDLFSADSANSAGLANSANSILVVEQLIEKAQVVIRESRQNTIYKYALMIEKFLADHRIPVNSEYNEKDFYTYNAYPMTSFIDVTNAYNEEIKPRIVAESGEDAHCRPFIYNFIHNIYFGKFELAKFFNIFYPNSNHKFGFDTYEDEGRLDKQLRMVYVHPKYLIEEVLHKLCLLEYVSDFANLVAAKDRLMDKWLSMDKLPNPIINTAASFDPMQINVLSMLSTLEAPIIRCFYDRNLPIVITNSLGLDLIEKTIKNITARYERKENTAKSFFDNRIRNTIFRIEDRQILKVFPLLDYEVVPLIQEFTNIRSAKARYSDTKHTMTAGKLTMDCHPNIAIRLAFNEYITYNIIGAAEVANIKLAICLGLIAKYGIGEIIPDENNVTGLYHPFDIYIKELRVKSIIHSMERRNNRNADIADY
jgi:hypothetical protein